MTTIVRTQFSPVGPSEIRYLRNIDGERVSRPHLCLPPEASHEVTVRAKTVTDRHGSRTVLFAAINGDTFEWSYIQGAWIRPLSPEAISLAGIPAERPIR